MLVAVLDVWLQFHRFRNIDLVHQGVYAVAARALLVPPTTAEEREIARSSTWLLPPISHVSGIEAQSMSSSGPPAPLMERTGGSSQTARTGAASVPSKSSPTSIEHHCMRPAQINRERAAYETKMFWIRYFDETVDIGECCLFQAAVPIDGRKVLHYDLVLQLELLFSDPLCPTSEKRSEYSQKDSEAVAVVPDELDNDDGKRTDEPSLKWLSESRVWPAFADHRKVVSSVVLSVPGPFRGVQRSVQVLFEDNYASLVHVDYICSLAAIRQRFRVPHLTPSMSLFQKMFVAQPPDARSADRVPRWSPTRPAPTGDTRRRTERSNTAEDGGENVFEAHEEPPETLTSAIDKALTHFLAPGAARAALSPDEALKGLRKVRAISVALLATSFVRLATALHESLRLLSDNQRNQLLGIFADREETLANGERRRTGGPEFLPGTMLDLPGPCNLILDPDSLQWRGETAKKGRRSENDELVIRLRVPSSRGATSSNWDIDPEGIQISVRKTISKARRLDEAFSSTLTDLNSLYQQYCYLWHNVVALRLLLRYTFEARGIVEEQLALREYFAQFVCWDAMLDPDDLARTTSRGAMLNEEAVATRQKRAASDPAWEETPLLFVQRRNCLEAIPPVLPSSPKTYRGLHVFVLVHGFQGCAWDMRVIRVHLTKTFPDALILTSTINEGQTDSDIALLGKRLSEEVTRFVQTACPGGSLARLSFVAFSLGGVIVRAALEHLPDYVSKFHSFISLSSPHLGYTQSSSRIVDAGMWLLKRFKRSTSLQQLSMTDHREPSRTFLYKLAEKPFLRLFKNVILVGCLQDQYSPFESARIEVAVDGQQSQLSAAARIQHEMASNMLRGVTPFNLTRIAVSFKIAEKSFDSFIGRAAHILFLQSQELIQCLVHVFTFAYC